MKKMRLEALEIMYPNPNREHIIFGFACIDRALKDVKEATGIDMEKVEILIHNNKEYHRKDYENSTNQSINQ